MNTPTLAPISLSIDGAAAVTGMSREAIKKAIQSGELPVHYPTAKPLILAEDLRAWVAAGPGRSPRRRT